MIVVLLVTELAKYSSFRLTISIERCLTIAVVHRVFTKVVRATRFWKTMYNHYVHVRECDVFECITRLSLILTSEGSKVRQVYVVVHGMEIRLKYRQYFAHCTSIARAAGINSRATM